MTMRDISRRLDRLNTGRSIDARRVVVMQRKEDEPDSAAIARWCEAHPDEPPLNSLRARRSAPTRCHWRLCVTAA